MPLYKFQVTDAQGKVQEITIDGDSQEDAVNRLRNRRLFPVQCYGEAGAGTFVFRKSFNVYAFTNVWFRCFRRMCRWNVRSALWRKGVPKKRSGM